MATGDETIFSGVFKALRRGRDKDKSEMEKGILSSNPTSSPFASKQDKQQDFLDIQSSKIAKDLYSRSLYYEADRFTCYQDYKSMDQSPEISAALDILSDEMVTKGDLGKILNIYSDNSRVKKTLEDLFYNTLNINYNIGFWSREALKYGDFFLKLEIDQEQGIYDVIAMPVAEIHREENPDNQIGTTRFKWDQNNLYFEEWQMAHFRILTDADRIPYGKSILSPARKLWKQLQLAEDAMLVYRLTRAADRRVFYIEVGNLDPGDIGPYMDKIKAQVKKAPITDQNTGNTNLKYNPMPIWKNTPVPLLDGRTLTIEQVAEEYKSGKTNYTYSVQDETNKIVAGKIEWCGKNYTADKLIKVWLDDNTWVLTAPEHPFVLRNGDKKNAEELQEGDALMPLYLGREKIVKWKSKGIPKLYTTIYNPSSGKYEFVHRIVSEEVKKEKEEYNTRHHIDINYLNNNPTNIQWMDFYEHRKLHSDMIQNIGYNSSDLHKEHDEIRRESLSGRWADPIEKEKLRESMIIKVDVACFKLIVKEIQSYDKFVNMEVFMKSLENSAAGIAIKKLNKNNGRMKKNRFFNAKGNLRNVLRNYGIDNYNEFLAIFNPYLLILKKEMYSKKATAFNKSRTSKRNEKGQFVYANHKVLRTEIIYENEDVYCMTIVGLNNENDRHNFGIFSFKENGEPSKSGVIVGNSVEEDYWLACRGDKSSRIETLPGSSNLSEISDIEYLQNKLFAALKVPKPYLNYAETIPGGSALAQADLRFSRTINHLQQFMVIELRRIANIHLYFLGLEDDLNNFELTLTNPSTQQELLKLETMKARLEVFKEMFTNDATSPVSYTWAMQYIMGFSESEIKQILRQKKIERKMFSEIEGAANEYIETGIFNDLDRKFRKPDFDPNAAPAAEGEGGAGSEPGGGGFGGSSSLGGGGSFGGGGLDAGSETAAELPGMDAGSETAGGLPGGEPAGGGAEAPEETAPEEELGPLSENKASATSNLHKKNVAVNHRTKMLMERIEKHLKSLDEKIEEPAAEIHADQNIILENEENDISEHTNDSDDKDNEISDEQ